MSPTWTENDLPYDMEDSEAPAIRARRLAESEAQRVTAEIARLPEMRMDLVVEMRSRLATGQYRVSPQNIADAMIRHANAPRLCR
jgi:anti-sigma28 factor (negative regulator of flagellin synthesis)